MDTLAASYPSVKPDFTCHNEYLYALTESLNYRSISGIDAAQQAESHLYRMLGSTDETVLPDKWSFTMVLSILSRSNAPDLTSRAEAVLASLEEHHEKSGRSEKTLPNANVYNSLMSCYTRHGNSDKAQKAIKLLRKMRKLGSRWNPSAQPSTISYNIVMNAFVKSRRKDAPVKVEALLHELYELYNTTGKWHEKCVRRRSGVQLLVLCL
jgi:pentatricopeptide repeat protein